MKSICPLIADILPLYRDGALSEESLAVIEEHLSSCENCRSHFDALKDTLIEEKSTDYPPSVKGNGGIPRYSKRIRKTRLMIASFLLSIFVFISASFFSFIKFDTPNFVSAGFGLLRIWLSDTQVVEIQKSPRVWLVDAKEGAYNVAKKALADEGYREIEEEQMGSMFVFEKNEKKHQIHFSANRYFAKLCWQE